MQETKVVNNVIHHVIDVLMDPKIIDVEYANQAQLCRRHITGLMLQKESANKIVVLDMHDLIVNNILKEFV